MDAIDTNFMGVAHLLRDRLLEVPSYQRSYSWTTDEVLAYWYDLRAALVAEQPVYFLGTVVLTRGLDGRSTVIDGQQRLATTSMLLAAVRDAFREKEDEVSAAQVASQYISSTSLVSQRSEPRLLLNHVDRQVYEEVVIRGQAPVSKRELPDSGRRIAEGYALLKKELSQDIQAAGPYWRQRLITWIQMLDLRTRVIVISVKDDADAFMIFETLNDRGLALTVADLVKNYLFGLARDRIGEVEAQWVSATSNFDNASASLTFTTFLRQWWSSLHGATRERDLYRGIRQAIQTETAALEALDGITEAAPVFNAILNPEDDYWGETPGNFSDAIRVLLELGLEQHRPLLLAAMGKFAPEELEKLLDALISWSVRGLVVGGIGGGTTERYYAEVAVSVSSGRIRTAVEVMQSMDPMIPSDRDFHDQFAQRRVHRTALVHYYLRALLGGRSVPQIDKRDYVLMPVVNREDYAPLLEVEEDDPVAKRIGNYILVPKVEAHIYRDSLKERLAVAGSDSDNVEQWIRRGIDKRQRSLADAALDVWRRNP